MLASIESPGLGISASVAPIATRVNQRASWCGFRPGWFENHLTVVINFVHSCLTRYEERWL
jgi:hypothetical protein